MLNIFSYLKFKSSLAKWACFVLGGGLLSLLFCYQAGVRMARAKTTSYLYAPGVFAAPALIGRYCSNYSAVTGEQVFGVKGGNIFGDGKQVSAIAFPEIDTKRSRSWFRRWFADPITNWVLSSRFGIVVREPVQQNAETVYYYLPNPANANIGQEADIACMQQAYQQHVAQFPDTLVVFYGDSRGAATVFNFIALHKPQAAGAVCEGVFDTIPHVIKHCWGWDKSSPLLEKSLHGVVRLCARNYRAEGPFPIDYAAQFPHSVPLLLVTSLQDGIVPYQSTMRLYCRVRESGHPRVRLLVLENSRHDGYMVGVDRDRYESCLHAFYRWIGVAYDQAKADAGQKEFEQTFPTAEEVRTRYKLRKKCCR